MPVAFKPNATFETSRVADDALSIYDDTFHVSEIDERIFDEVLELLEKQERFEKEIRENAKKIEKLQLHINAAKEAVLKAEDKRNTLIGINTTLKDRIDKKQQSVNEALDFWKETFGIDVRQLSKDTDNFKHYEFTFSKLPQKSKRIQQLRQTESNDSNSSGSHNDNSNDPILYKVGIKHDDNKLFIVSQEPELITTEELETFNVELTETCICHEDSSIVDYKLAVLKIKKKLS